METVRAVSDPSCIQELLEPLIECCFDLDQFTYDSEEGTCSGVFFNEVKGPNADIVQRTLWSTEERVFFSRSILTLRGVQSCEIEDHSEIGRYSYEGCEQDGNRIDIVFIEDMKIRICFRPDMSAELAIGEKALFQGKQRSILGWIGSSDHDLEPLPKSDKDTIEFPIMWFSQGTLGACKSEANFRTCNTLALKNKFFTNMKLVDSEGRMYVIKDAVKIGYVPPFWGWRMFLERIIKVEPIFKSGPAQLSLDEFKDMVCKRVGHSYSSRVGGTADIKRDVRSQSSFRDIIELFLGKYE